MFSVNNEILKYCVKQELSKLHLIQKAVFEYLLINLFITIFEIC